MHVALEYLFLALCLMLIVGLTITNISTVDIMAGSEIRQNQLMSQTETMLKLILLSPGSPTEWNSSSCPDRIHSFGLALAGSSEPYELDGSKVYALEQEAVQARMRSLLGVERTYGFYLRISPIYIVNITGSCNPSSPTVRSPTSTSGGWSYGTSAFADGGNYAYSNSNGNQQVYGGYGFSLSSETITQVRVRLDAWTSGDDDTLLEVYDGSSWLPTTALLNVAGSQTTYWVDVTGWTSWTPSKVNSIQTRVTHVRSGMYTNEQRLDWIPVEVTTLEGPTYTVTVKSSKGSPLANVNVTGYYGDIGQRYQSRNTVTDMNGTAILDLTGLTGSILVLHASLFGVQAAAVLPASANCKVEGDFIVATDHPSSYEAEVLYGGALEDGRLKLGATSSCTVYREVLIDGSTYLVEFTLWRMSE